MILSVHEGQNGATLVASFIMRRECARQSVGDTYGLDNQTLHHVKDGGESTCEYGKKGACGE